MQNQRIYWQVGENPEHEIPAHAKIVIETDGEIFTAYIDEDGNIQTESE